MDRRRTILLTFALLAPACDCGGPGGSGRDGAVPGYDGPVPDGWASGDGNMVEPECGDLHAVIRDFRADHPDFEDYLGSLTGIVQTQLGPDGKPVYAHPAETMVTTGPPEFDQWYRDVDGVNTRYEQNLPLTETSPGNFLFDDPDFFPLDGMGGEETMGHNFHFTTEIHATFTYRGGEVFTFNGDDDVFVFVNGQLALDLGGVHGVESDTIDFDAMSGTLGIVPNGTYTFDVFHAERHTVESNFRVETSIACFGLI